MGIYDRDYARRSEVGPYADSGRVIGTIIAINVVVYVMQVVSGGPVTDFLKLDPQRPLQVWRLLTYAFCHNPFDVIHILFNMLVLFWFGREMVERYGTKEFVRFYLAAAIIAGMAFMMLSFVLGDRNPSIGASGAVMAVMMLYCMYYPRRTLLLFFVFPVEMRWIVLGFVIYDLFPVLSALGGAEERSGIAHAAHLGGLAYGYAYYKFDLGFGRMSSRFRLNWSRRSGPAKDLRVYVEPPAEDPAPPTDLDDRVDAILEKISTQGQDSLDDEEKQILIEASKRFRNRRGS